MKYPVNVMVVACSCTSDIWQFLGFLKKGNQPWELK